LATKRVGILSGTFDPIHNGHLALARDGREQLALDEVWVLVNGHPPGKSGVTSFAHRMAMVRLAALPMPYMVVDREPVQRQQKAHSLGTAQALVRDYPGTAFTLLMGADVFCQIGRWEGHAELFELVDFGVAERPNIGSSKIDASLRHLGSAVLNLQYRLIAMPSIPVSAAQIRAAAAGGRMDATAPTVGEYIRTQHLYGAK
jgi:nicotinate-nucleotide adenylyltransferase